MDYKLSTGSCAEVPKPAGQHDSLFVDRKEQFTGVPFDGLWVLVAQLKVNGQQN